MKKVNKLLAALLILGTGFQTGYAAELHNNNAGVQLNQNRRYLEEQRVRQRIEEGRKESAIENETAQAGEEAGAMHFVLQKLEFTESGILTQEEAATVAQPYLGKEVTVQDLYKIVNGINKLYSEKGYLTCRAFLLPQTIENGAVKITLVEGRTGEVHVRGNKNTRADYISHRVHLHPGEIDNTAQLNEDLLRFNAMNDVQLRIALGAGKAPGTTDYVLAAVEPQTMTTGIFADNGGSRSTGVYREGMYWMHRSLTGSRDNLFISAQRSEGTKAVGAAYTTPINRIGTKLGVNYSTNSVKVVDGPNEALDIKGHASAYSISVTNPMETTQKVKSQWGVEIGQQKSVTDIPLLKKLIKMDYVDDTVNTVQAYIDQVNYGNSTVFYQKHGYRYGYARTEGFAQGGAGHFGSYVFNTLYQKNLAHGQNVTMRWDGQYAGGYELPSAEQYYLGGIYSVRGYKQNLIGGDSGFTFTSEYAVPLDEKRSVNAYGFFDGGRVYGNSMPDDADRALASAGIGVRANVGSKMVANVGVGVPLIRTINSEEQSRGRVFFSVNGRF